MLPENRPTLPASLAEFQELEREAGAYRDKGFEHWLEFMAYWGEADLFFYVTQILSTKEWLDEATGGKKMMHPFVFERCREIQAESHDLLRIYSREHLKSTLGTFASNLWDVTNNPEETIAILSFDKSVAMGFLGRIVTEMEENELLPLLWPNVFWLNPQEEARTWSLSENRPRITVKRKSNVAEPTFTAYGLDKALKTGPHHSVLCYDDIVVLELTRNLERMAKVQDNWKASLSLGREGGRRKYYGTFYHPLDVYHHMVETKKVRCHVIPCWTGPKGKKVSVFYSMAYLEDKLKQLGQEEFGIQWECNPRAGKLGGAREEWLRWYKRSEMDIWLAQSTLYMLVDPASSQKEWADFTVIQLWACRPDKRVALVDMVRDRLDPSQREDAILAMWEEWDNGHFIECRWESYGFDEAIHFFQQRQIREAKDFPIAKVHGGRHHRSPTRFKTHRIEERLLKKFREGRILLPDVLFREQRSKGGAPVDLMQQFKYEEYLAYPVCQHDDMLDCASRLWDPEMPLIWPGSPHQQTKKREEDFYDLALKKRREAQRQGNWMSPSV